jgi:hypothetical protein
MRALSSALVKTVTDANADNSIRKADEIYDILLLRAKDSRFVSGYRDEFRRTFPGSLMRRPETLRSRP